MKKTLIFLIIVISLAAILRVWQLGSVPMSMSDDETRLVYNSYSIWKTGKDVNSHTFPLAFMMGGYAFNPIPIYLVSPFVGIFDITMFTSRLPFAIAGILTVLCLYFLAEKLIKNKTVALLSALTLSFSAWHLQLSRFAYEGGIALFFYVLGITIFLYLKKGKILGTIAAMLIFLLAFNSYSGTKLIFLPIIITLVWYKFKELNFKQILIIVIFTLSTFLSFAYLSKTQGASQYGSQQFFFQNIQEASFKVELERRASSAPEILRRIYHNKLTYWFKIFIGQYQYAFSPQYLFISQEGSGIFSVWFQGQMYYIEAPLILLGILYLFQKRRRELFLMILLLIIAPLPSGLGSYPITYTIRSSFMLPWLVIFIGAGVYSISYFVKNRRISLVIYLMLIGTYTYLIGGYLTQYYFEWAKYSPKYYSKSAQDISLILAKEKKLRNKIFVDGSGNMLLLHYALYNKLNPSVVQKLYKDNPIVLDNIRFKDACLDYKVFDPKNFLPKNSLYAIPVSECRLGRNAPGYPPFPYLILQTPDKELDEWLLYAN